MLKCDLEDEQETTMKETTSRKQKAMETRIKILEIALDLFKEKGMNAVKVTDICQTAGVSVGAFYHHFPSKESIIERGYQSIDAYIEETLKNYSFKNCREKILFLFKEANLVMEELGWKFIGDVYKYTLTTGNKYTMSIERFPYRFIRESLEEGVKSGELRKGLDSRQSADFLMKLVRGITFDWCICEGSYSLVEEAAVTVAIILKEYAA